VTTETKTVSGIGTYATGWQYNNVDWVTSMIYPGDDAGGSGESVSFDYVPQGAVETVTGDTAYASGIQYDAAGRITQLVSGNVTTSYEFYGWIEQVSNVGQGGRLSNTISLNTESTYLQDLSYTYDQAGNIASTVDDVAIESLTFSYDELNQITGTTGIYTETYSYDFGTGNLANMNGTSYTYAAEVTCPDGTRTLPHAVSQAGTNKLYV
jgi:hypothetical protein